uniref:Uncharacterized protein n=1 Tax=Arundo donax TaxID=35708 RepID=A0A0A9BS23_ARUDO
MPRVLEGADQRYQHRSEGTVWLHSSGNGGALGVMGKAPRPFCHPPAVSRASGANESEGA